MKRYILATATTIGLASLMLAVGFAWPSLAAEPRPGTGQALEIAPPVINLTADPGQVVTAKINLRDVSTQNLVVHGQVNNFTAAGEDGTPKLLLDSEDKADDPYSIKTWVSPLADVTLKPRQVKDMNVTIRVPQNAAPGGYFGVVRFTANPPELDGTGVSLNASLGSLIFIRVNGDAKESLKIEDFFAGYSGHPGSIFESAPVEFTVRLNNTGNTHLQPVGQITVKDMFGNKVANVNVNLEARNILPGSIRKFTQSLDSGVIGDKMLFGQYSAELNVTYGAEKQKLTATTSFWVIPYKLIGLIVIGLIIIFFVLRWLIRRYNRNIINRSRGGGLNMRSGRR